MVNGANDQPRRLQILVVEDDVLIAMDLEDLLHELGCEVVGPFGRLNDALSAAEAKLDGAVVDLNLREENSFPLIDRLQERSVPVIVCSGYADIPKFKERLSTVPTLAKPCSPHTLAALMHRHFGWRGADASRRSRTRSGTPGP
jgi:DNA-binding NtrC family response regulator